VDESIERLLGEYEDRDAAEWKSATQVSSVEFMQRRDERLLCVGRSTGLLLNMLIRESRSRFILELGTSYGYSTIWLAEAAMAIGGSVMSLELCSDKLLYARQKLADVGLASAVTFLEGDARYTLESLSGPFDFVLIDLWKELYVPCFDLLVPRLSEGGLVIADNMLRPVSAKEHTEAYRQRVRDTHRFDSVLLAVGSGLEVSRLIR
jgi:predicted O-methyltransferase YrrM